MEIIQTNLNILAWIFFSIEVKIQPGTLAVLSQAKVVLASLGMVGKETLSGMV